MAEELVLSFNEQLRRLKRGESLSRVERVPATDLCNEDITGRLSRMRKTLNAQVSKLRDGESGSNFRVESAVTLTNDNEALLAVVAITRI